MKNYLVTLPDSSAGNSPEFLKEYVSETNKDILMGVGFPTCTRHISARDMLGDPNHAFSEEVAEKLAEAGVLCREPWMDARGKQATIVFFDKSKSLLWKYSWGDEEFSVLLDNDLLLAVGWDLRNTPGFCNIVVVGDEVEEDSEEVAESDESPEEEESVSVESTMQQTMLLEQEADEITS